jgi:four helix bundle protein
LQVVKYIEWERAVPRDIRTDPLWSLRVYRVALYAADLATHDGRRLAASPVTERVAGQLVAAAGSIGVHIAEGYSRLSNRDRVKFYEYALGSAREAREWYLRGRIELGENTVIARIATLTAIAKVLLVLIDRTRPKSIR